MILTPIVQSAWNISTRPLSRLIFKMLTGEEKDFEGSYLKAQSRDLLER